MANIVHFRDTGSLDERRKLIARLTLPQLHLFRVDDPLLYLPFTMGKRYECARVRGKPQEFKTILTPQQKHIATEGLTALLNDTTPSILLTLFCGGGKTVIILWILAQLGLPALILVPRIVLKTQWKERIAQFCPTLIYSIQTIHMSESFDSESWPILVLDEVHQIFTREGFRTIFKCAPLYLIGASATPWRPDELNVFELFFSRRLSFARPTFKSRVLVVRTGLTPQTEQTAQGKLDWNSLLNWQASDPARIEIIVRYARATPTPQLILTKRVAASRLIADNIGSSDGGEVHVQIVGGTCAQAKMNPETTHLIATFAKLGTGFDCAALVTLLLTSDVVEYFEQYAGRILRNCDSSGALFVEFLDNFAPLWSHFAERRHFYDSIGAKYEWRRVGE